MTEPVHVIGMGLSPRDLTGAHLELISRARVLVGGRRHLEAFAHLPALKREITSPLPGVVDFVREAAENPGRVVVLASGDPLFFGIGKTLAQTLGPDRVTIHPNVTSMAGAFARLKLSWQDASWISLHGRQGLDRLRALIETGGLICVLTDPVNNPGAVARLIAETGVPWTMWILEDLGGSGERIRKFDPGQARALTGAEPNVVVLRREDPAGAPGPLHLGTPDHWFIHERGLITKAPVRAVALSALGLVPGHIVWDLGAGSGSVGLEATLLVAGGGVWAVEKNLDRVRQIRANAMRFGVENLTAVHREMPGGLDLLPRPDRVFVGGGGRGLGSILDTVCNVLNPGGRVVVSTVLLETLNQAVSRLGDRGFSAAVSQIQIRPAKSLSWGRRMEPLNPVWLVTGERKA